MAPDTTHSSDFDAGTGAGLVNFRDLGGLPTQDGGRTREGVLYRADAPLPGDPPPAGVTSWPPATVIDLRADAEMCGPHPLSSRETTVHRFPLLDPPARRDSVARPARRSLPEIYVQILHEATREAQAVFELAAQAPAPLLVHCAGGKDRTGVLIAMLLRIAGVPDDAVREDYRRTSAALAAILRRQAPRYRHTDPNLLGTPDEAVDVVLGTLTAHPGGAAGYLAGHGVRAVAMEAWRARFVWPIR